METIRLGFALCGSFCTYDAALRELEQLRARFFDITPILSEHGATTDSRFGAGAEFVRRAEAICGRPAITTIAGAEPIGPKKLLDVLLILPCTGNTIAKLAGGVTDSAVTMAAKAHLRNERPVVLAVSTNDGLAGSAQNIGQLLARRNYYFVPFRQDDPAGKPRSLVADFSLAGDAVEAAFSGRQLQPILLGPKA